MRKVALSLMIILLAAAGCGSEGSKEINGKKAEDIPVEWAIAMIQRDDAKRLDLLVQSTEALDPEKGPQNEEELDSYQLTEWKASEDKFFYEIKFVDPVAESTPSRQERMEVVSTEDGWKRTQFGNLKNFETLVEDIESRTIKELHEE
ncbi:hypothetical protein CAY60_020805 [Shouchella clausii]|nr:MULTISPECIES: hypothetical protein [Shouchella]NKR09491.1 hypothetical protein [Escherichia coli]ALA55252.1 hypothetical protein DB29_0P0040 [Shouchella clausii]MBU3266258.1 hypothetical protein [Shouchella clausii]MBU3509351.1 hypothetical protein [Shouchella clausii]MDP0462071.1 hypothetical protein [Shouchella rhizosphaerae]